MLYEIRNYHIRPETLAAYTHWAKTEAVPHLAEKLDLVGFWISNSDPSQITGEPMDKLGSANVTWILRWRDRAQRDEELPRTFSGPAWEQIFSRLPGGLDNYLRMEAKFTQSLT
jgi:hypothetical protein